MLLVRAMNVADSNAPEPHASDRFTPGRRFGAVLAVCGALLGVLLALVRPWYLAWGTTPEQRDGALPGDEMSPGPPYETRAIEIAAPSEQVFAWISQLGQDRAGFYSYTALENLVGCEMPDVRHLDPALQHWQLGDKLWMYPHDELDGRGHATLLHYEPGRALVFGTHTPVDPTGSPPTGTWSFVVEPTGPQSAVLLTRGSGGAARTLLGQAFARTVFEPLHFAMERRMLEGIRGLAEGHPISRVRDAAQLVTWAATFALFVASGVLVVIGSMPRRRLLALAAAGVAFQVVTLLQPSPAVGVLLTLGLVGLILPLRRKQAPRAGSLLEPVS